MESFLQKAWNSKVWILATMFLTLCANTISSSLSELEDIWREQLDFSLTVNDIGAELSRQNQVLDLYQVSIGDLAPLLDFYYSNIMGSREIAAEEQSIGHQYSVRTLERLRQHQATLEGIRLSCVNCRELQNELFVGVSLSVDIAMEFVNYFKSPNSYGASDRLASLYNQNMSKNLSIAETVIPAFTRELNRIEVEFSKNIAVLHRAEHLSFVIFICLIYIVVFSVVAIWKFLKFRKRANELGTQHDLP